MTNPSPPSDLFAQIRALADANIAKKKAKETPGVSTKTKTKLNAKAKSAKKNLEDMIAQAAKKARKKVSPWHPTAIILPVLRHHCKSCQAEFTSPGGPPLVRFEHKRNGTIWETSGHPSQQNPNLPQQIRVIDLEVEVCQECFSTTPILSEPGSPQLPLPLEFPTSKGINIFPTKETLEMTQQRLSPHPHPIGFRLPLPSHPLWPEDPNRPNKPFDPWEDIPQPTQSSQAY
jgi:hypothetical protein